MGRAKQAMMEYEGHEWEETLANFTCPECGKLSESCIEIPKVVDDYKYEDSTSIVVECSWCNEHFAAEFSKKVDDCEIRFDDYPKTLVEFDPVYFEDHAYDFYDDPSFYDHPDDPFFVFKDAYRELIEMTNYHAVDDGKSSINRMLFIQSFSIFEAYLCDTFLNLVFLDDANQKIFIDQRKGGIFRSPRLR